MLSRPVLAASRRCLWVDSLPSGFVSDFNPAKQAGLLSDNEDLKSKKYDTVIIGGGHNGLVAGSYLAKRGKKVAILEKRHCIGGAAITEELIPGFKFSRASYLLALLRPQIVNDLELKKHGLKWFVREPHAFTPMRDDSRYLLLGSDKNKNRASIEQFSTKDAENYDKYNNEMEKLADAITFMIDAAPIENSSSFKEKLNTFRQMHSLAKTLDYNFSALHETVTAPMSKVLDKWFESDILKACLATDAVIGAMLSPDTPGYVLLHHVMGGVEGHKGAWAYVEGGMGGVSLALAKAFKSAGGDIYCEAPTNKILVSNEQVQGVELESGEIVSANTVLSNPTAKVTFKHLIDEENLPADFLKSVDSIDYTSPVTKLNIAVDRLPDFKCAPNKSTNQPLPHHYTTIHMNCESMADISNAHKDVIESGTSSKRPIIEMTIPSVLDSTIAPEGKHTIGLFTQYSPIKLNCKAWTDGDRDSYADRILTQIEDYAPGFKSSILGVDVLTPQDLEATFGLTGGNIFHGAMGLDQLFIGRPATGFSNYRTPIKGLYLCGSGAHPGGGVMGAPGKLCSEAVIADKH